MGTATPLPTELSVSSWVYFRHGETGCDMRLVARLHGGALACPVDRFGLRVLYLQTEQPMADDVAISGRAIRVWVPRSGTLRAECSLFWRVSVTIYL